MMTGAPALVGAGLGLVAMLVAISGNTAGEAPDPCQVSLALTVPEMTAAVSSGEGAQARSTVIVTFQKPASLQAVVRLVASTDTGWPITVEPELRIIDSGTGTYFLVSVEAPPASPAGPSGTVRVVAQVAVGGFSCPVAPEATASLTVLPYLDVFSGQIPVGSVDNEGSIGRASFDIVVRVRSNTAVHVAFIYHADSGIAVDSPAAVDFPATFSETAERSVSVVLRAPSLRPGSHDVNITVRAEGSDLPAKDGQLGLTIIVPRGRAPAAMPWGEVAAAAGAAAAVAAVFFWSRRVKP